jgi:hypothetical protein
MAITHSDIGLSQPAASTITMKVGTVTLTRNSTVQHQDLITLADPDSTNGLARITDSAPASSMFGLVVRPVGPTIVTFASTAGSDSATSIVSSNATSAAKVYAFTVTSTVAGPVNCGFYAGATLLWPLTLWAAGGQPTVSLAVSAPTYLFRGSSANALTFNVASTGAYRVAVSYQAE